jgi:hypothetical protein
MLNEDEAVKSGEDTSPISKRRQQTSSVKSTPQDASGKTWSEWVKELGVNRAIARGACSEIMADWDDIISRESFESAVKAFGEKGHGR